MYVAPIFITEERTIMVRVRTQMKIWFDKGTLLNFQNSRTDINSKVQSMSAVLQKIVKKCSIVLNSPSHHSARNPDTIFNLPTLLTFIIMIILMNTSQK